MARPKRQFRAKKTIKRMVEVLNRSIWTDETKGINREPLGRSDTYWLRNTLKSMLKYGYINDKA